jgi:hypothetical protein
MGYRIRETGEYLASNAALRTYFGKRLRKTTDINAAMLESLGVDSVFEGPAGYLARSTSTAWLMV